MANRDVFPTANFRWPPGPTADEAALMFRLQRDELMAALEGVLFHHQPECLCALDFVCAACSAKALIDRIKAGR